MPTNRFQFSDDFVLNNGYVGINSATPQEELDVVGVVRGDNLKVVGVSSFTTYEGFLNSNHNITENTNLEAGKGITGSLSGEVIVGTGLTVTGISSAVSGQGQVDSLKVYTTLNVPVGLTTDRPIAPKPGQLFYNREFATVEFYTGDAWRQVDNTTQRGRGVFGGGVSPSGRISTIDFIQIHTQGNSTYFGELTYTPSDVSSCSSSIRGVFAGGTTPTYVNTINYITIASEGNAISFGTLSTANRAYIGGCSSSTRGLFGGGYTTSPANATVNVIDYIQISTLGNALDFGDLFTGRYSVASFSSPTRAIWAGGAPSGTPFNVIDFVTIASTGNAVKFGELTERRSDVRGFSNSIRGVFGGGRTPVATLNTIDYVTIASTGNATDFGDLTNPRQRPASCSSQTRGIWGGGYSAPLYSNVIDFISIATTGNAQDFGDLSFIRFTHAACSDSHGGLGGF